MLKDHINFYDNYGNRLNVIGISKPFSGDNHYNEYLKIRDSCVVIGVSIILNFLILLVILLIILQKTIKKI